jgi:hypothetical protein
VAATCKRRPFRSVAEKSSKTRRSVQVRVLASTGTVFEVRVLGIWGHCGPTCRSADRLHALLGLDSRIGVPQDEPHYCKLVMNVNERTAQPRKSRR